MSWKQTLLVCLGILLVGSAVTTVIFYTEPTASRTGATKSTAMLVDVVRVERDTVRPTIEAMGTVEPREEVVLRPRVSGEVLRRSDAFTPGGYVQKGDTLLQIDPADYRNALRQRESELQQAVTDLKVEQWRKEVAEREYQLRGDSLGITSAANRAIALREPQLDAARSQVESARAAVEQAELNLQRTTVTAPFDAHILTRNVTVGSQVGPGDNLARLVGRDTYWVEATVPLSTLRWLTTADDDGTGAAVRIRNRTAWADGTDREGRLLRVVGALDDQTRMARVLIEVPDPHARASTRDGAPRLMLGSYVETQIEARPLNGVIRLNRDYVRDDDTVWVMDDGTLRIRDVNIVFRDARYAYIDDGLGADAQVVTTNLSSVTDGAPLRTAGDAASGDQEDLPDPAQ